MKKKCLLDKKQMALKKNIRAEIHKIKNSKSTEKINKTSCSLNLTSLLPSYLGKKKKTHIAKIRNKRKDITTDPLDIKRKMKQCYLLICEHNVITDETDQVFERYNLSKVTEIEIGNMNRPISTNEIESITLKKSRPRKFLC